MDHIGIDLHKKDSQICILAEGGELIERRVRTDPHRFAELLGERAPACILLEASTESEWVARCLEALGHHVVVADPNFAPMCATRPRKDRSPRCPCPGRGLSAGGLPPSAPALRCPAPCPGPPHRPGCAGADADALPLAHPCAAAAARLAGALGQRGGVSAAGTGPAPARPSALRGRPAPGRHASPAAVARLLGRADRRTGGGGTWAQGTPVSGHCAHA